MHLVRRPYLITATERKYYDFSKALPVDVLVVKLSSKWLSQCFIIRLNNTSHLVVTDAYIGSNSFAVIFSYPSEFSLAECGDSKDDISKVVLRLNRHISQDN